MTTVHVVVPEGVDDPRRPSGGNVYDRRLCQELAAIGWDVREREAPGSWPAPGADDLADLGATLAAVPDGQVVLVDGLVASAAAEVLLPEAQRVRLVVLVHMPLGEAPVGGDVNRVRTREGAVLSSAAAVVTSSTWTRDRLLERHSLREDRVHVAEPGVDLAELAPGTARGGELLCVAAVTPLKGHDVLLAALAMIEDPRWRCTCVGSLDRDPGFVERLRKQAREDGVADRVVLTGPLTGRRLERSYAAADLVVLASRGETYGMVVTEAFARGLPVVATAVGGLPRTVGGGTAGASPGILVPPESPTALAGALTAWLGDTEVRRRLRQAAADRRTTLTGWTETAARVSRVLAEVT